MHRKLSNVDNIFGIAAENGNPEDKIKCYTEIALISDNPLFFNAIKFANDIINKCGYVECNVNKLLAIIHDDSSADAYINDFPETKKITAKCKVIFSEKVYSHQIADITDVNFPGINITKHDKIIYCFKSGWRFGLYFNLGNRQNSLLDVVKMKYNIAYLHRYISYYNVYEALKSSYYEEMSTDGWFPYIQTIPKEWDELIGIYNNKFNFDLRIEKVIENFPKERIEEIVKSWWNKNPFELKRRLLQEGIDAYTREQPSIISCIKILSTEIEGLLRIIYKNEYPDTESIKMKNLFKMINDIVDKKHIPNNSLLLPNMFTTFLAKFLYGTFDPLDKDQPFSRNTSGHGELDEKKYTKAHALQLILILDQIYFFI